jgi:aminoglycoside phosphotransferase (APT) family kinase protein
VPDVLEVGNRIGQPYMISHAAAGRPATDHPQRLAIVEELGRIAARIHTVKTNGLGETFDWSQNQLSRADDWAEYLRGHLRIEERVALLTQHGMLSEAKAKALRAELSRIAKWADAPSLNHGDLRLKNLLVDDSGHATALIDWEFCLSAVAPHWDLSLALHDLSIDQKQALLAGYGLNEEEVRSSARSWAALNLVNYAPFVEQAAAQGDEDQLETYRTRMSGALDLYSL